MVFLQSLKKVYSRFGDPKKKREGIVLGRIVVVVYPLTMAFMVGLRFSIGLWAMLIVSGSRSIVIVMAPPLCMIRWGLRRTLMLLLGTLRLAVEPSANVALAVSTCIFIMV